MSSWFLANVVARHGQLRVVSGTVIDGIVARRLQDGDPGGHNAARARELPFPDVAARVVRRYYVPDGIGEGSLLAAFHLVACNADPALVELTVCANYAEGVAGPRRAQRSGRHQLPSRRSRPRTWRRCTARCSPAWTT